MSNSYEKNIEVEKIKQTTPIFCTSNHHPHPQNKPKIQSIPAYSAGKEWLTIPKTNSKHPWKSEYTPEN